MSISTNLRRFAMPLLLVTFLTACGAVTPYVPKPTVTPTLVRKTPKPADPTFTPWPTAINTLVSPIDSYIQNMKEMLGDCQKAVSEDFAKSPDGNWTAYKCPTLSELFFIYKDGSKAWHLSYDQFSYSDGRKVELGTDHWSGDSQYIYFSRYVITPCCWDPGYVFMDSTYDEIWQFDLKTGKYFNIFDKIGSPNNYPSMSTIYFSPDDKTLLVIPQFFVIPPVVYVYDLQKNKVIHSFILIASNESIATGNVVWSADGQRFALASASGGDFENYGQRPAKEMQYSVIVIDLKKMSQKAIITNEKRYIYLRAITQDNILLLESTKDGMGAVTFDQYDLTTNQFLTPVPSPTP